MPESQGGSDEPPTIPVDPKRREMLPDGSFSVPPQQISFGVSVQNWQMPYPPPDAVERYEKILPGAFGRMLIMAEQAQAAQVATVRDGQKFTHREVRGGQMLGFGAFCLAFVCALGALYLHASGYVVAAFLCPPAFGAIRAFVAPSAIRRHD